MADIQYAYAYSQDQRSLVRRKSNDPSFSHRSWQDDDLVELRSAVRDHYRTEQSGRCAYCRNEISLISPQNAHVEHIAPKSKHPRFIFEPKNLCVICADCSAIKRDQEVLEAAPDPLSRQVKRYPRASSAFRIVHPHFDRWDEHILKVHGFYVDRTPKGHFTIGACVLNRKIRAYGWDSALTDSAAAAESVRTLLESSDSGDRATAIAQLVIALLPKQATA